MFCEAAGLLRRLWAHLLLTLFDLVLSLFTLGRLTNKNKVTAVMPKSLVDFDRNLDFDHIPGFLLRAAGYRVSTFKWGPIGVIYSLYASDKVQNENI